MFHKSVLGNLDENGGNIWVAVSVIVAGLLVAGTVIFTSGSDSSNQGIPNLNGNNAQAELDASTISPVTEEDDYMIGNIDSPIKIVEYSDTECVFCKRLHETLHNIVSEYSDHVTWVYRHMPIIRVHPKALTAAHAAECAGEQGGGEAFWQMLDSIYDSTPGGNRFNLDKLPEFAMDIGLDIDEYNSCMDSNRFNNKIQNQIEEGFAAGAQGAPFVVVITPDGNHIPVSGAQPESVWRQIIDEILAEEV